MKMIQRVVAQGCPTTITEDMLIACNVPENDYNAWSSSTAYIVGGKCTFSHKIYECLVGNTNFQPNLNTTGTTPKWLDCGYTNRWMMFDAEVGSQTSQATTISLTLKPGLIDSLALLDIAAATISLVMTDPVEGVVYTESLNIVDNSYIIDAYTYAFEPILTKDTAVLLGIPAYGNASLDITISNPGGVAKCGTIVAGVQKDIGCTQQNPSISITDYSKKEIDEFGNYKVVQRAYSKRMSCETWLANSMVDNLQQTLAAFRATPVVWVGTNDGSFSSMIIYGFYKSFSIAIAYQDYSICTLEIEGLS